MKSFLALVKFHSFVHFSTRVAGWFMRGNDLRRTKQTEKTTATFRAPEERSIATANESPTWSHWPRSSFPSLPHRNVSFIFFYRLAPLAPVSNSQTR